MRKSYICCIFLSIFLILMGGSARSQQNVTQLGRWGKGQCEAIFRRGEFTFIGNGSYLEVYETEQGVIQKKDALLLPGPIKDIWVRSGINYIFVACGSHGLVVVQFDTQTKLFSPIYSQYNTADYAYGVMQFGLYLYLADGENGLRIYYLINPFNPQLVGTVTIPGITRNVWVLNDTTVLVAADTAGIYTIRASGTHANPILIDSLDFETAFPLNENVPDPIANRIVTNNDSVAYVAAGLGGGIRIIDVRNPGALSELSTYVESNPLNMLDLWIDGNYAYVVAGDQGIYAKIDVTDPENPSLASYNLNTEGFSNNIVVEADTAYVSDGYNGMLLMDVADNPVYLDSVEAADKTYDVAVFEDYAYLATGESGLKVLDINTMSDYIEEIGSLNTPGEAYGIKKPGGSRVYVADGSRGLSVLSVFNPAFPSLVKTDIFSINDVCTDVDLNETYAFLACGKDGLRIVDITETIFEVTPLGPLNTPGSLKALKLVNNRLYLADSSGVYIYDVSGLPTQVSVVDSLTDQENDIHAVGIDVYNNKVVVANGEYGILLWDTLTDSTEQYANGEYCSDLVLKENTIYMTDSEYGLRIFDYSLPNTLLEMGYFPTGGNARRVAISDLGDQIYIADGSDGFYVLQSTIQPEIDTDLTTMNFGRVPPQNSRPMILWVMNTGTALLNIDSVKITNSPAFSFSETNFSVIPGDTHSVTVYFNPSSSQPVQHSATAAIFSNDFNHSPLYVSLQGEVGTWIDITQPYQSDILTLGLWHIDEQTGATVYDVSAYNQDALIVGQATRTDTSKFGRSVRFHGTNNSRIEIPYNSIYNLWDRPFTVELWFYMLRKPTDWTALLLRGSDETIQYKILLADDSKPVKGIIGSVRDAAGNVREVSTGSMAQLNTNQWYHVALTWDKDSLRFYVNSINRGSVLARGRLFFQDTEPISIGSVIDGQVPFSGYVDEVRISNVARQSWEFPVNKSRLFAGEDTLRFGKVFVNHSRRVPLHLMNTGTQPLIINNIHSSGSSNISIAPALEFVLYQDQDTTVWITYTPVSEAVLGDDAFLVIESTDPTYPSYSIPLSGEGVYSLPAGKYNPDPFTLGLWHLDEVGGNTVNDESIYDLHGTFYGDATLDEVNYKFSTGRSLHFGGDNGICVIPVEEPMPYWGGFAAEGWFRLDGELPQPQGVIFRRGNGTLDQVDLFLEGNALKGRLFNQQGTAFTVTTGEDIQYGQWYHAAISYMTDMDYQNGVFRLYLNGNEIDTVDFEGQLAVLEYSEQMDSRSILIGNAWDLESPFYGNIDEVRFSSINRQSWEFNVEMARIQVSQSTLDFGKVYIEGERKLKLWITNPGMDTLRVDSLYTGSPNLFHVGSSQLSVAPYDSQAVLVEVRFTPDNAGSVTDTLKIVNNDPFWKETPYAVILIGEGVSEKISGPYVPDSYTRGLYHFDEETGTIVIDASADGMDGALIGGVTRSSTARFGRSLSFDGTNGRATISDDGLLDLTESEFTIELWFSMLSKAVSRRVLISKGSGSGKQFELSLDPVGGMKLNVWNADGERDSLITGNPNLFNAEQWYHTAFVWDEDSLKLYLNNYRMGSLYMPDGFKQIGSRLVTIGADSTALNAFHGYIDEIRFSNIARADWEFNVLSPSIVVYPTELNFATVWINHSRILRFSIKNNGDQDLEIENITGAAGVYSIPDSLHSFTLPRLRTQDVEVSFTPTDADVQHDQLVTITSNDQVHPTIYVTLRGIGTESKLVPGQYIVDAHTTALYQFNSVAGDTLIYDASDGGHHALLRNGVRWISNGLFGGALLFDGIDDYVEVSSHPDFSFDPNTESCTIECFFRTDTTSQTLFSKGYTAIEDSFEYSVKLNNEGRLQLSGRNATGPRVNTDSWHHFALAYNHVTRFFILYLDGDTLTNWQWSGNDPVNTQRPFLLGAAELDSALYNQYFEGYIDEVRISDIAREPWEFGLVDYGIEVVDLNPDPPVYGQSLTLQVRIPADLEAETVNLYYGSGGARTYQKTIASILIGDTMQVVLPSTAVTLKGLEYYVEVFSGEDTLTYPILDPRNNPISSVVRHNGVESSLTYLYRQFQMFSVPFNLDSTDVRNVLEDDLGEYDPYQWRLFWWEPQDSFYIDYRGQVGDSSYFKFEAGRSYWIITDSEKKVDVEAGTTVSTDSSFNLILNPGWNMIGDPYNFSVGWDDCSVSSDSVGTLYYYDPINGYQLYWNELSPWKGYWVYNADEDTAFLSVLPRQSGLSKPSLSSKNICKQIQSDEWVMRFSTWTEGAKDQDNFAGMKRSAETAWDIYDQPEPPPVGDYVSFFFDHSDWTRRTGRYAVDIREQNDEGCVWDCCVETKISDRDVHLSWEMFNDLPEDWEAYFIDLDEGYSKNLLRDSGIQFRTAKKVPNVHQAKLIVGTREFIEKYSEGIPLEPIEFRLSQNYPNPFNPDTKIDFSLPKKGLVKIIIYNALGQKVKVLLEETRKAGHHQVAWNGLNEQGFAVSSGVYLYRIETHEKIATKKMVLIR